MIRKYLESDIEEILDVWYQASVMAHPFLDADFMGMEKGIFAMFIFLIRPLGCSKKKA